MKKMKNILGYLVMMLVLVIASTSCSDILDQEPVDSFNEESVFNDIDLTKAYLGKCYDFIGGNGPWAGAGVTLGLREDLLSSGTDECLCIHRPNGYKFVKGTLSPDEMGHYGGTRFDWIRWEPMYKNIKNVNVLLANIADVPAETAADEALKLRIKAEAHFIRAFNYTNLMRSYGGVILVTDPYELDSEFLNDNRSSLQETIDFILADIDKALTGLPNIGEGGYEQGRASKGAAAALKSRVLSWASGELVNGGYEAGNPLVSLSGGQTARLQAAQAAAKAIMDGDYGNYALTGGTDDPPANMTEEDVMAYADNFYNIFTQKGEWNSEVIWGVQYLNAQGNRSAQNKWFGPNGYHNWGNNNPLEPVVREFEMKDGTAFEWDKYNPGDEYVREATAAELIADPEINPYVGREPRFYATVLYDGAKWQARAETNGFVETGYKINEDGSETAGYDTRQGLIEAWNGTKNGYYIKKYMDINTIGQYFNNENAWIEFRYAEVVMDYAEASIELGGAELTNGINALNMIRNRAGLPDRPLTASQDEARAWLRHERLIEFFGEGERWYNIRKWMIADEVIKDVHAMKIYHFADGSKKWHYDTSTTVDARQFTTQSYWLPISRNEINKAPQLTQNPGYD